jgi:hypothetical protein
MDRALILTLCLFHFRVVGCYDCFAFSCRHESRNHIRSETVAAEAARDHYFLTLDRWVRPALVCSSYFLHPTNSVHEPRLRQGQALGRLGDADLAIGLDGVLFGIDAHARHDVVELHVALRDVAAVLDGRDAFAQAVGCYGPRGDAGFRDEEDTGGRDQGCEHWAGDDGLDRWDGCVGVALCGFVVLVGSLGKRGIIWREDSPSAHRRSARS